MQLLLLLRRPGEPPPVCASRGASCWACARAHTQAVPPPPLMLRVQLHDVLRPRRTVAPCTLTRELDHILVDDKVTTCRPVQLSMPGSSSVVKMVSVTPSKPRCPLLSCITSRTACYLCCRGNPSAIPTPSAAGRLALSPAGAAEPQPPFSVVQRVSQVISIPQAISSLSPPLCTLSHCRTTLCRGVFSYTASYICCRAIPSASSIRSGRTSACGSLAAGAAQRSEPQSPSRHEKILQTIARYHRLFRHRRLFRCAPSAASPTPST